MSSSLLACAICFGAAHGPQLDAARLGVLVMVGVTCTVLALLARFFLRLARNQDNRHFSGLQNQDSRGFSEGR